MNIVDALVLLTGLLGAMRTFFLRYVILFWTSFIGISMCGFPSSSIFTFQSFSIFHARTISALSLVSTP